MPYRISRQTYAETYGPTTGDRLRLADTDLILEVEQDCTVYGDEVKFGGGKVIRDGMGQAQTPRAEGAVDTVITNALILDWWGVIKADVGLKDGRIVGIGKAGNPDTQQGVTIVVVMHDINLAARYADKMLALLCSEQVAYGEPKQVVTEKIMHRLYGLNVEVLFSSKQGHPVLIGA